MRLDDLGASLLPASLPPTPGLAADSCSYGREFATRFFQLHLAATPCVSLRLPSSVPVGSFHPTRFCPCRAHWGRRSCRLPGRAKLDDYLPVAFTFEQSLPNRPQLMHS